MHPISLRFEDPTVEAAFSDDYFRRSLLLVRGALGLGLLLTALFGLLDRPMVPASAHEFFLIRLAMCAGLVLCIAYTFAPWFRRTWQAAVSGAPLLVGGGSILMAVVGEEANVAYDAYAGVMLVLMYVHVLLRLRFVVATVVGGVLIAAFAVTAALAIEMEGVVVLSGVFFLGSANLTGMAASYTLERYARRQFVQARLIEEKQGQLEAKSDALERANQELAGALEGVRAAQARLVQQEKMASLGRLTAGVAHEIKNPLNFVVNFAGLSGELLAELRATLANPEGLPPERVRDESEALLDDLEEDVQKIREHGARADAIVHGMLAHARPSVWTPRPTDLNALVAEQAEAARAGFVGRHSGGAPSLTFDLDPAVGEVPVVPQEIGRVVASLVSNALDAVAGGTAAGATDGTSAAPAAVRVRTRRQDGRVEVVVEDDGPGIAAEHLARLFEPFFTTKPPGEGTGLGLSLAHDVALAHGGELSVTSKEGEGATFTLVLPAAEPAPVAVAA